MKMLHNRRGTGVIGAILLFLVFLIIYFVWLGSWLGQVGRYVVANNSLVGIEAFFFNNLNFVVLICLLIAMVGWSAFGGGQR